MRLLYISQGNVPSRWAHTVQTMKMAEAFGALLSDFCLVTQAHWMALLRPRFDFEGWYGIRRPFRIVRLPALRLSQVAMDRAVYDSRFDRLSAWYARMRRPDIVYTRSPRAAESCVRCGLRVVLETHSMAVGESRLFQRLGASPELAGVVTVTETLRALYAQASIPESKLLVAPDAADPAQFLPDADRTMLRTRLGLPQGRPLAAYVGHMYQHKGVDDIVEAARFVPEVNFALIGGWPEDVERLHSSAARLDNVRVREFVPNAEVPLYLAAADVLLLPNSGQFPEARTTSPLKLFEYMAARRPVIASAIPALSGLLTDGSNALVVTPDDPRALAAAVRRLVADAGLAERLAATAHAQALRNTWSARAEKILGFIAETANA